MSCSMCWSSPGNSASDGLRCLALIQQRETSSMFSHSNTPVLCYSNRKRMSVVVRTPDGNLRLYCKGAVRLLWGLFI